jgi:hypothetical protein
MEGEMAGRFEWCNAMTDMVEKEICLKEAEELLKQLKEENCHPEPDCWEQARAHYDQSRAVCDAMTDQNEKEICYKEAERVYEEWTQGCSIRECHQKAHEIHEPMFEECNALTDP